MSSQNTSRVHERNTPAAASTMDALRAELEALAAEWHKPVGSAITGPTKIACAKAMLAVLRRHVGGASH